MDILHSMKWSALQCRCFVNLFGQRSTAVLDARAIPLSFAGFALTGGRSFPKRGMNDMLTSSTTVFRTRSGRQQRRVLPPVVGALAVFLVAPVAVAFSSAPAAADFRVCNATQNLVGVGIGYRAK